EVADLVAGQDATITLAEWDTSGTGRPEQRGALRPIAFGACWAPLVQVDELTDGRIYAVSCREVDDIVYVCSQGVALTPTLSFADTATWGVAARKISDAAPGPFLKFVPNMVFEFVGSSPSSRNDGVYTIDGDLVGRDRIIVESMVGSIPTDGAFTGT